MYVPMPGMTPPLEPTLFALNSATKDLKGLATKSTTVVVRKKYGQEKNDKRASKIYSRTILRGQEKKRTALRFFLSGHSDQMLEV